MNWRCVTDIFGYCVPEPKWSEKPTWVENSFGFKPYPINGKCSLDPKTCGNYQGLSQQIQPTKPKRKVGVK